MFIFMDNFAAYFILQKRLSDEKIQRLDPFIFRQLLEIQNFYYSISYVTGEAQKADYLSRSPCEEEIIKDFENSKFELNNFVKLDEDLKNLQGEIKNAEEFLQQSKRNGDMVCRIYKSLASKKSHDVRKIFEDKVNKRIGGNHNTLYTIVKGM